jgi:murein DD-endopeptidase MepM/ murein hydrolase activator NlpD
MVVLRTPTTSRTLALLLAVVVLTAQRLGTPKLPDTVDHLRLARTAKRVGNPDLALLELRTALVDNPESIEGQWLLAWILAEQRDVAGAEAAFGEVQRLAPGTPWDKEAAAAVERLHRLRFPMARNAARNMLGVYRRDRRGVEPDAILRGKAVEIQTGTGLVRLAVEQAQAPYHRARPVQAEARLLLGLLGRGPRLIGLADRDYPLRRLRPGDRLEVGLRRPVGGGGLWPLCSLARLDAGGRPTPWAALAVGRAPLYTQRTCATRAVVAMAFPVLDGAAWHDTWLAPRAAGIHLGQDLAAPRMRPLVAPFDGTVFLLRATREHPAATLIVVGDNGWQALYTHLNDSTPYTADRTRNPDHAFAPGLDDGARVRLGQLVGWVGDSGIASGPHCHIELRDGATGDILNATPSLHMAQVFAAPRFDAVARDLLHELGGLRLDGFVRGWDPERRVLILALRSRMEGWDTQPVTRPARGYVRCDDLRAAVLGAEQVTVSLGQLPGDAFVIALGMEDGQALTAARLVAEVVGLVPDRTLGAVLVTRPTGPWYKRTGPRSRGG